jgi:hypothetical protein
VWFFWSTGDSLVQRAEGQAEFAFGALGVQVLGVAFEQDAGACAAASRVAAGQPGGEFDGGGDD